MNLDPDRPLSVLVADDDHQLVRRYSDVLRDAGFDVTTADDGAAAMRCLGERTFDIVLLDVRMPHRNGASVLRTLRSRPAGARTSVFLLAQPGDTELVDRAMKEDADGVFEKAQTTPRAIVANIKGFLAVGGRQARLADVAAARDAKSGGAAPFAASSRAVPDAAPASVAVAAPRRATPAAVPRTQPAAVADPVEKVATAPVPEGDAFDTVLNRFVGQSARLATALGLPADLSCPVCNQQLALRLRADPAVEGGVRGHFVCTRCTRG